MLTSLFNPSSVAVVGASKHKGKLGHTILLNIIRSGFAGRIFPINPTTGSILGLKCYPSVPAVPANIDLVVFSIPAQYVLPAMQEIVNSKKRVKSAIIISAGFKETGPEGAVWESEIARIAAQHDIRMIGPNCIGLIDSHTPLNTTFSATVKMPPKGHIAFFSQSGALCMAILDWVIKEGTGLSKLVSLGNKIDVDEADLISYLGADKSTSVILGYLEGIKNGRRFIEAARKVSRIKPIVILKGGVSEAGSRAVSSHTGSLAGKDVAYQSAFRQSGIIRVNTIAEMFDIAKALSVKSLPPLKGPRLAIITNSGGPAVLATDRIEKSGPAAGGVKMAYFTEPTIKKLRETLPKGAGIYNPVDVIADASSERYRTALETALQDKNVDGVLVIFTPATKEQPEYIAENTAEVFRKATKPILTSFMGGETAQKGIKILEGHKIPHYPAPESAIAVFEAMYKYEQWIEKSQIPDSKSQIIIGTAGKQLSKGIFQRYKAGGNISLDEAMQIISAYGIQTPKMALARSIAEAHKSAEKMGYPVVLKIISPDISHKTDVGGVKLNIHTPADLTKAYKEILDGASRCPVGIRPDVNRDAPYPKASGRGKLMSIGARVYDGTNIRGQPVPSSGTNRGIAVQKMITGGKEIIIGVNADPQFGHLIMFGLGGIYVEVLKDVSWRLAPLTAPDADAMIKEIRAYQLLTGIRGEDPSDIVAIKDTLLRVSQLVTDFPQIMELDINPLKVFSKGGVAIDVRIRV